MHRLLAALGNIIVTKISKENPLAKTFAEQIAAFSARRESYVRFVEKLKVLLEEILHTQKVRFHTIEGRVKTLESIKEKLQRPGKKYINALAEIPDLAGLRIILYTTENVEKACHMIDHEFQVDSEQSTDKGKILAFDQFGYLSVHKIIRIASHRANLPEWANFSELHAEVQVRTVLQHAWAAISHHLQYKREAEIPIEFRRKLMRLAGLLELADEQFTELSLEERNVRESLSEKISRKETGIPINRVSIMEFLKNSDEIKTILEAAQEAGFDNSAIDPDADLQLPIVAQALRIDSIGILSKLLKDACGSAFEFFSLLSQINGNDMGGDADHWSSVILVGMDKGKKLAIKSIPWISREYTINILKAGKKIWL